MKSLIELKKVKKVAVGLSGGVDSSVAAFYLVNAGYDVTGVHMRCWDYNTPGCHGNEDRADAIKVAAALSIPFTDLNFEKEYKERVLNYFFSEVKAGRTPNPDVVCNTEIKFGLFLNWAIVNGFDYVATGHYAQIVEESARNPKVFPKGDPNDPDRYIRKLLSGLDESKDQSYFLYRLSQKQLGYILFPIGRLRKAELRKVAKEAGLVTHSKPDSTGICFIGDIDVKDFIKTRISVKKGKVLDITGNVIGEHDGSELYTIGQRHGFSLTKYVGLPLYVISKDTKANTLTVGFGKDAQRKSFEVSNISWINKDVLALSGGFLNCKVRIRNLGEKMHGVIRKGLVEGLISVELDDYALGVAPGQSAVFYDENVVLGGGIIV